MVLVGRLVLLTDPSSILTLFANFSSPDTHKPPAKPGDCYYQETRGPDQPAVMKNRVF